MASDNKKFTVNGLVLKGPVTQSLSSNLDDIEIGLFINDAGDLVFKDNYVKNVLKKDSITLRELYNKNKGVFVELVPDPTDSSKTIEKMYFKDGTVSRAYSLEEIVNLCQTSRRNLITGPLWWVGRTEIDHTECANIQIEEEKYNPNSINLLWSIDRFLSEVTNISKCETPSPMTFYEKSINPDTGEWVWWDVQNLEIVVPPISDPYKLANILAKISFQSYNMSEPIIFRLYDATIGKELTRTAITQANSGKILGPVILSYFGNLYDTNSTSSSTCSTGTCGCSTTTCVKGDPNCFIPNSKYVNNKFTDQSHIIKVQFHAINYHPNHWERVIGAAIGNQAITKSSIDMIVFDVNPSSKLSRKHGSADFTNTSSFAVEFSTPVENTNFSIQLTPNKNIKCWYSNKTESGFIINTSKEFTGNIDWTVILLNN